MIGRPECAYSSIAIIGWIVSFLFAAAIGVLFTTGLLVQLPLALAIALALAALSFLLLAAGCFLAADNTAGVLRRCICANIGSLLTGIFGTILTTVAALAITLAVTSVASIILVVLAAFFFTTWLYSWIATLLCAVRIRYRTPD